MGELVDIDLFLEVRRLCDGLAEDARFPQHIRLMHFEFRHLHKEMLWLLTAIKDMAVFHKANCGGAVLTENQELLGIKDMMVVLCEKIASFNELSSGIMNIRGLPDIEDKALVATKRNERNRMGELCNDTILEIREQFALIRDYIYQSKLKEEMDRATWAGVGTISGGKSSKKRTAEIVPSMSPHKCL